MKYCIIHGWLLLIALAIAIVGCAGKQPVGPQLPNALPKSIRIALEQVDKWELLSLDPDDSKEYPDGFHNFRILGTMTVQNDDTRKRLFAALMKGIPPHRGATAACFWPRHGIRVTHEGKNHDVLICFQCIRIHTYVADQDTGTCEVDNSLEPLMTELLRQAGVPLPDPPK